ncbi:cilia- and flagella-associated protein 221 isoform X2 [Scleropages formosus]|uniref:cilia- and flagella-associated protein 221 isoform X2 n=1 Tax=Scleropages formosus TaxID=113540 RepID=UPI0008781635|nr:cilia- and flagella-associated protein 221 isoform X2 [Scleropages formosus]
MELAPSTPESFTSNFRKKIPLPLGQLVEETRRGTSVPHHLLESKIYTKLQSNSIIQVHPSVVHFSGFQLGKVYQQVLKLINISSEVINIHILPTQTKYFKTKYTKKFRLVPGLCYTVTVLFYPDEWRYFYDCIWVHCQDDENLFVPVHAYPVITDLHIPAHISLSPSALGQSVSRSITLKCSCSVDFEFQVHFVQPHRAFSVQPLSGVIPANGRVEVLVTFTPLEYGTMQTTLQVIISQFNSKPYMCTITGSCSPHQVIRQQGKEAEEGLLLQKEILDPQSLSMVHLCRIRKKLRLKTTLDRSEESRVWSRKAVVDVSTPAALAKVLMRNTDKMSYKPTGEVMPQTEMEFQTRQAKEALFESRVSQDVQEERSNHLRWQVRLGKDPVSAQTRKNILEEREKANHEYKIKKGNDQDEDLSRTEPRMSTGRVLRSINQLPSCVPQFHMYYNHSLEIGRRVFLLFQQSARKVLIRCRMNHRLMTLRPLIQNMKKLSRLKGSAEGPACVSRTKDSDAPQDISALLKLSRDDVLPFTYPIFTSSSQEDEFNPAAFGPVLVKPTEVQIKPNIPFFKLKVPQQYKLKGYKPVSAFEASTSYIHHALARPLRNGAQDEILAMMIRPSSECDPAEQEKQESPWEELLGLTFKAPPGLFRAPNTHPLRIFNPAPGLLSYKSPLPYLECDLDFHLCPLPKYAAAKGKAAWVHTSDTQKKFLDRKEVIRCLMTWKKFQSPVLSTLSTTSTLTKLLVPRMSDPFNDDLLPASAPPALNCLPVELKEDLLDGPELRPYYVDRQCQASKLGTSVQAALSTLKALVKTDFTYE